MVALAAWACRLLARQLTPPGEPPRRPAAGAGAAVRLVRHAQRRDRQLPGRPAELPQHRARSGAARHRPGGYPASRCPTGPSCSRQARGRAAAARGAVGRRPVRGLPGGSAAGAGRGRLVAPARRPGRAGAPPARGRGGAGGVAGADPPLRGLLARVGVLMVPDATGPTFDPARRMLGHVPILGPAAAAQLGLVRARAPTATVVHVLAVAAGGPRGRRGRAARRAGLARRRDGGVLPRRAPAGRRRRRAGQPDDLRLPRRAVPRARVLRPGRLPGARAGSAAHRRRSPGRLPRGRCRPWPRGWPRCRRGPCWPRSPSATSSPPGWTGRRPPISSPPSGRSRPRRCSCCGRRGRPGRHHRARPVLERRPLHASVVGAGAGLGRRVRAAAGCGTGTG